MRFLVCLLFLFFFCVIGCVLSVELCDNISPINYWAAVPQARIIETRDSSSIHIDKNTIDTSNDNTDYFVGGFRLASFDAEYNSPPFCMNVGNVQNRAIEVIVETLTPNSRICVKDLNGYMSEYCFNGRGVACANGPAVSDASNVIMKLVFYCDKGCDNGILSFYYRVAVSASTWLQYDERNSAIGTTEMWCSMRGQDPTLPQRYPSGYDAVAVPENVDPRNTEIANNQGGASSDANSVKAGVASFIAVIGVFLFGRML